MKLLVFSDAHGHSEGMRFALSRHPDAGGALFLGDGIGDFMALRSHYPALFFQGVLGNCDLFGRVGFREEETVPVCGTKILMMHGHRYGVKSGIGAAVAHAAKEGADVLLYGHTHIPAEENVPLSDGWYLLAANPGSVGRQYDGVCHYGILTVTERDVLFSVGEVTV